MQNRVWLIFKLLTPNRAKAAWLEKTLQKFQTALHQGIDMAAKEHAATRSLVHRLVYPLARALGLPSALARPLVTQVLSAVRARKRGEAAAAPPTNMIGLGSNAYTLVVKGERWYLRLTTGGAGFLWFPLIVPPAFISRMERVHGDARLVRRGQAWFVHLPSQMDIPEPPAIPPEASWIGIDLGINRLVAVAAPDRSWVVSGQALRKRRQRAARQIEQHRKRGCPDRAHQVQEAENRWMQTVNHQVASRLVNLATHYPNPVFVLENLDGLFYQKKRSSRFACMRSAWDFPQLVRFIQKKARQAGIQTVFVDPRGTSQTCPRCGYAAAANTDPRGRFHCQQCHYQGNSDLVAARNLARRGMQESQHG